MGLTTKRTIRRSLLHPKVTPQLLLVVLVAVVGVVLLTAGHAAVATKSLQVESGISSSTASTISSASASGSSAVKFKAPVVSSGMWKPTADKPLKLGWILGDAINLNFLQTKNLIGQTIPEADVYDIEGFTNSAATVQALHNKGKKVICYIDTGVWEAGRPDDSKFPGVQNYGITYTGDPQYAGVNVLGSVDTGWDSGGQPNRWLDIRRIDILAPIMKARIQMCKDKGFDSIEPDEMVNYTNNPGFPLTYADQLKYNKAVASWAHEIGISIGLKDDHEQAHDLVNDFDWMLDEECWAFDECLTISDTGPGGPSGDFDSTVAFSKKNKAVWIAEYPDGDAGNGQDYPASEIDKTQPSHLTVARTNQICNDSIANRLNTAFYITGLPTNGGRTDCPQFPAR